MKIHFLYLSLIVAMLGCQFLQPDYVQMVSPQDLNRIMQQQDIVLIDVHTPEQRHIKGTDLVIPYNDIDRYRNKLPADKTTPIYLYCEGGPMGNAAARALHDMGYSNLFNLQGGVNAWKQAGFGVE
jgi:rhodanese-related sulfurtransferase